MREHAPQAKASATYQPSSLGYQVNLFARLLARLLQDRIAPYGVVPGQFAQLLALYDADGQTPSELSRAVRIEPGTMTKTLRRMERDGLVERRPDSRDGRAVRIYLTEQARELEEPLKAAGASGNELITRHLSAERQAEFMRTLSELIARTEQVLAHGE